MRFDVSQDDYFATTCFCALANMAPHAEGLHPYAAQRMVSMLRMLVRKHARASATLAKVRTQLSNLASGVTVGTCIVPVRAACWPAGCLRAPTYCAHVAASACDAHVLSTATPLLRCPVRACLTTCVSVPLDAARASIER